MTRVKPPVDKQRSFSAKKTAFSPVFFQDGKTRIYESCFLKSKYWRFTMSRTEKKIFDFQPHALIRYPLLSRVRF
ncbi:hypothetical protein LEP1GSC050_1539 [Leptospira broomii serovar Hurstbridge str. 5399]|uniref:Uncharacterized protein n=1 Tax=Leptospira broomii serovar Hurstbridge str. 5399 TaxID=1049789 RepID=T0F6P5_9LEPT|nr:hypothetical protein LEP1GSC050_1539 [Leptospira broomii serovar Hurstbridge str. 5399]